MRCNILIFLLILSGLACAGPTAQIDPVKVQKLAAQKDYEALKPLYVFVVRYNPAPCNCTDYEVKTPTGWRRVVLQFQNPEQKAGIVGALHAAFKHGIPDRVHLQGEVDDLKPGKCGDWCIWLEVRRPGDANR